MTLSSSNRQAISEALSTLKHVGTKSIKSAAKTSAKFALMGLIDPYLANKLKKLASGGSLQFTKEEINTVSSAVSFLKYALMDIGIILKSVVCRPGDDVVIITLSITNTNLLKNINDKLVYANLVDSEKIVICLYKEYTTRYTTSTEVVPPILEILKKNFTINSKLTYLPRYPRLSGEKIILDNLVDKSPIFSYFVKVSTVANSTVAKLNNALLQDSKNKSTKLDIVTAKSNILIPTLSKIRDYAAGKDIKTDRADITLFTTDEFNTIKKVVENNKNYLANKGITLSKVLGKNKETIIVQVEVDSTSPAAIKLASLITPPIHVNNTKFSICFKKEKVISTGNVVKFFVKGELMYLDRFPSLVAGKLLLNDLIPRTTYSIVYDSTNIISEINARDFILFPSLTTILNFVQ